MSEAVMDFSRNDPTSLLGAYLRAKLPSNGAKALARANVCEVRTAEGYIEGRRWPSARHWVRLVAIFGADITEAVFHPEQARQRLEQELHVLEEQLSATRRALAGVAQDQGARPADGSR